MIASFLLTTLRFFKYHKVFTVLNISGLAIGFTFSFFAWRYVIFELSYDRYHIHAGEIYRMVTDVKTPLGTDYRGSSAPMAPAVRANFPEVESATRILLDYLIIGNGSGIYDEERIAYADSTLFSVFTFPLLSGNPATVLNAPFKVVLSQACAEKYFGKADPTGRTLLINGTDQALVSGVMKDIPYNSHFRVDMLVSMSTLLQVWNTSLRDSWTGLRFYSYVLLDKNADAKNLGTKFSAFVKDRLPEGTPEYIISLEPLKKIYLEGKPRGFRAGTSVTGNIRYLYIFALTGLIVLLVSCFNFINLTTAFFARRVRETGLRKVLGASRRLLIFQYLHESVLISLTAYLFSLLLISSAFPHFNRLAGKMISPGILDSWRFTAGFSLVALLVGLLAGLYPAVVFSGFKPLHSLKLSDDPGRSSFPLRKILIILQFSVSIILVASTLVIFRQVYFMKNHDTGYKKEHMLVIDYQFDKRVNNHLEYIRNRLAAVPGITSVSFSSSIPGKANHSFKTFMEYPDGSMYESTPDTYFVDYNFFRQFGIRIIAGRAFSEEIASDSIKSMVINESMARNIGYRNPEDAVGKRFIQTGRKGEIIGVVRNFHIRSFREEIQPLTFQEGGILTFLSLEIHTGDLRQTVRKIEKKWHDMIPGFPLSYSFADEDFDAQYNADEKFGKLFGFFALAAVSLSCLGIFGLTAFSITRRTKEIGIRKVLGSSVSGILRLLTGEFMILITVSAAIAIPVSRFILGLWLTNYAYRINLTLWIFLLAALTVSITGFASICFPGLRAANADPVKTLRND